MKTSIKLLYRILVIMLVSLILVPGTDSSAASRKLKLNMKKVTITVGDTCKLEFNKPVASVKWTSKDRSIATVSKEGLVKAKSRGTVTITAKVKKKSYKCVVTVKDPDDSEPQTTAPDPDDSEPQTTAPDPDDSVPQMTAPDPDDSEPQTTAPDPDDSVPQKTAFNPDDYRSKTHLRTSLNPENYVDFNIDGSILTVSGKLNLDRLTDIWIRLDNIGDPVSCASGEFFSQAFTLYNITDEAPVTLYKRISGEYMYWSYIWKGVYVMKDSDRYIIKQSPVLENNLEKEAKWVDPQDYLEQKNEKITALAKSIVGDETDRYRQLWLINEWMAENIYYNYDYYYSKTGNIVYDPEDVLDNKTSVCEGYANLQSALIRSLGIPCMKVSTYSTGVSTKGYFDDTNASTTTSNHAHVEAYLESENRWVAMDATWDSCNKYENGEYKYSNPTYVYFDASPDFLALSHKIIRRP